MIRKTLFISALCLLMGLAGSPAMAHSPQSRLQLVLDRMLTILKDPRYKGDAHFQEQKERIQHEINEIFDFRELSRRAVGKPWLKFTDKQKDDFTAVFSDLLERTYENRIRGYQAKEKKTLFEMAESMRILYTKELIKKNKAMVLTEVVTGKTKIPVNYRMILKNGDWWVYDVIVEGVSLVKNYRTQFKDILIKNSPDHLIEMVRDKVREEEAKTSGQAS